MRCWSGSSRAVRARRGTPERPGRAPLALALVVAARLLTGAAEAFVITSTMAWGLARVGPAHAGKVFGWMGVALFGGFAVGAYVIFQDVAMGLAPPVGGALAAVAGLDVVYLLAAVGALGAAWVARGLAKAA